MKTTYRSVVAVVGVLAVGCTTARIDPSLPTYRDRDPGFVLNRQIEARMLASSHVTKIIDIHAISYSAARPVYQPVERQTGYDVLRLAVSLAGEFGFEGAWHGDLVVRKKHTDRDWKSCELFYPVDDTPASHLATMTDMEMAKHLKPYWGEPASAGDAATRAAPKK